MRSRAFVALAVLAGAVVTGGWLLQRGLEREDSVYARARLFDQVVQHVSRHYVDTLSERELYQKAIDGMLQELGDPYSVYLTPERQNRLLENTRGTYGGLGIQIDVRDGWITVIAPTPGTPADRAGIQTGDRIVAVDGRPTQGLTPEEALHLLRGPKGSRVALLVERPGLGDRLSFQITRADIRLRAVQQASMLNERVGYVDLNVFSDSTTTELRGSIDSLRRRGMQALVLDLRQNPGGLLEQGVEVSDLFLDRGQKIVSMRGRTPVTTTDFVARAPQSWPDLPIVVLVNGGTASASEIVAGALQDHDRAVIVGSTTFGKGSAQSVFRMPSGGALKLTTARWFTPVGRSIQRTTADSATEDETVPDADSAAEIPLSKRRTFKTGGGRTVYGGGGITPDLIISPLRSPEAELAFQRALGSRLPRFRDALTDYAIAVRTSRAVSSPGFVVTEEMREELWRRMRGREIAIDRSVYDAAAPLVSRLLGYEIARYVFGTEAEFQRRLRDDRVVGSALELAAGATTQQQLLRRAIERRAEKREDVSHSQ